MVLILAIALGAAILAGLKCYRFITGRSLIPDILDSLRLEGRSLESWDAACAENPHRADIIVCLTSTPARLPRLDRTLKSLMAQSTVPLRIRLHIPRVSIREGRPYKIPPRLSALRSVEIVRCDDLGPVTKLLPALRDLPPDQAILIVDDDSLYPPTMIADFSRALGELPAQALALSGHVVPPDLTDRPDTLWSLVTQQPPAAVLATRQRVPVPVDILRGCDGYLVRPRFFNLEAISDYRGAPPAARWVDDVWISAHCLAPKYVTPARRMPFYSLRDWFFFERSALHRLNNPPDADRRANTVLIRFFARHWMCSQ
jgi:hypothetical protein